MKLYNTLTKSTDNFSPYIEDSVSIYSCGPTVYDHAHIGNLSAYIFADTLRRVLNLEFTNIKHAMNYTDVDDKTISRSKQTYPDDDPLEALRKLTDKFIKLFLEDMASIGNDTKALTFIRATDKEVIVGMKKLITELYKGGFAYIADDGVYFSIDAYRKSGKTYGQLADVNSVSSSESRIQNDEYDKESASDFALWKKQKTGEPAWEFKHDNHELNGRPGWHIECSVMSRQELGQPFDIHTGGVDLIFPHHENEIAQSTACERNPVMAKFFAHNEHILVDGKKMAKSANNFYTLQDIVDKGIDPLAFRMLVLQAHYRSQAHFSWENLEAAGNRLNNFKIVADIRWQPLSNTASAIKADELNSTADAFKSALLDDLNTPQALAVLSELFTKIEDKGLDTAAIQQFNDLLDLVCKTLSIDLRRGDIGQEIKEKIKLREQYRDQKDWVNADIIRKELTEQNIGINDSDRGPVWFHI